MSALVAKVVEYEGVQKVQFVGLAKLKQVPNAKWLEYTSKLTGETKRYKLVSTEIELPNGAKAPLTCQVHEKTINHMADQGGEFTIGEEYLCIMNRVESTKVPGTKVALGLLSHLQGEATDNASINDAYEALEQAELAKLNATAKEVTTTA